MARPDSPENRFLVALRMHAGEAALNARIKPMDWVSIARQVGLNDNARSAAVTLLREKGLIVYKPESTEIIALTAAGVEVGDRLTRSKPTLTDPLPDNLEDIRTELDYWQVRMYDGQPSSDWWIQVKERIDALRHSELRHMPVSITTNNAIGPNSRINVNSVDQSTNAISASGVSADPANGFSASDLARPRFREPGQPLGALWSNVPAYMRRAPVPDIRLVDGPSIWLRLIPSQPVQVNLSLPNFFYGPLFSDQKLWLAPLHYGEPGFLRAEDGFGVYSRYGPADVETESVAFVFEDGQFWATDLLLLKFSPGYIVFQGIRDALCSGLSRYATLARKLGIEPPFHWVAGLDGIKGRRLNLQGSRDAFPRLGEACISDKVWEQGTFDGEQSTASALLPLFQKVFRKASMEYPGE